MGLLLSCCEFEREDGTIQPAREGELKAELLAAPTPNAHAAGDENTPRSVDGDSRTPPGWYERKMASPPTYTSGYNGGFASPLAQLRSPNILSSPSQQMQWIG